MFAFRQESGGRLFIEWDWCAANDGGLTLWIDGAQQSDLTGADNDTRRMDRARLGPLSGLDAGTSGTDYFDSFESRWETPSLPSPWQGEEGPSR